MKAPIIIIIIGVFLIAFFAVFIDTYSQNFLAQHELSGLSNDIFYKIFGEFKNYLSDMSYIQADVYYHSGIHVFGKCEKCAEEEQHIKEEMKHEHEDIHVHKNGQPKDRSRPSANILLDIGKATVITEHKHLSGNEEIETLPWFYYAVKLNPHNETAYSVGGFWLVSKLKKVEKGINFLKEGLANNPDSWEICATLGQIYLLKKKDHRNAITYLEKAKELGEKQNIDRFGKRRIYVLLAEAYKKYGDTDKYNELTTKIGNLPSK